MKERIQKVLRCSKEFESSLRGRRPSPTCSSSSDDSRRSTRMLRFILRIQCSLPITLKRTFVRVFFLIHRIAVYILGLVTDMDTWHALRYYCQNNDLMNYDQFDHWRLVEISAGRVMLIPFMTHSLREQFLHAKHWFEYKNRFLLWRSYSAWPSDLSDLFFSFAKYMYHHFINHN